VNIFSWLRNRWNEYKENQKWKAFYARLDRNKEGRFTKNQYMKDIKKVSTMKKDKK
jgi:hypothetical protein